MTKNPKCKNCGERFKPKFFTQPYCTDKEDCSSLLAAFIAKKYEQKKEKDWKKQKAVIKESLLTKKDYFRLLQATFNAYIRKRDEKLPCISCGTFKAEEFHAGHYIPSTYSYLRFNENNCHKQCSKCNTHLRGNIVAYRINLIKKIGLEAVENLEADRHKDFSISIPELKELIKKYKSLAR